MLRGLEYKYMNTFMHRMDPRAKVFYPIVCMVITLLTVNVLTLTLILSTAILLAFAAKTLRRLLETLRGLFLLTMMIFLLNLIFMGVERCAIAFAYAFRLVVLGATFSIFFMTTSPEDMALAMVKVGIPYEYALAFMSSIRFVPTLARDLQTIIDAQRSRGLELDSGGIIQRAKNFLPILIPLMVFEIRRSYRIAEAMESRAFGSVRKRTYVHELRLRFSDYVFIMSCVIGLVLYLFARTIWGV